MAESTGADRERVTNGVYQHLRWVSEEEESIYRNYIDKVHKLVTVQLVLFAAISYGLSQVDWHVCRQSFFTSYVGGLGAVAAICLAVAFYCGIRCLEIREVSVIGVEKLHEVLKNKQIAMVTPDQLWGDLSQNVADGIIENRERAKKKAGFGVCLNIFTVIGFFLVAAFVVVASMGNIAMTVVPRN